MLCNIFMLISLLVNLESPFLLNSIDLDWLKGRVAAFALIEAESNHKVDFEHCNIFMLISLLVNLESPFLLNSIDLDWLKGLVAAFALIEAESNHKVDFEHCKSYVFYCMNASLYIS